MNRISSIPRLLDARTPLDARTLAVSVALLAPACASPSPDSGSPADSTPADSAVEAAPADGPIEGVGTVRFVDLEGGCWAIDLDGVGAADGERVQPANLEEEFRVDSLRVTIRARPVDAMSFCMLGRMVQVEAIERVDR